MDKKKKIRLLGVLAFCFIIVASTHAQAQIVDTVQFCDKEYKYENESDTLTLFLKVRDKNGKMVDFISNGQTNRLRIAEGDSVIPDNAILSLRHVTTGVRIPSDVTFSVLVDLGISKKGKEQICEAIETLVKSAGDSPVFLSYFGDVVGTSKLITSNNYSECCEELIKKESPGQRCFYSALYSKLTEFSPEYPPLGGNIPVDGSDYEYVMNLDVSDRANGTDSDKNILFFFTESTYDPLPEPKFTLNVFNEFQHKKGKYNGFIVPKVYAFVFTPADANVDPVMVDVLDFLGQYTPSNDFDMVIEEFKEAVISEMYDYAFTYQVGPDKSYNGKRMDYTAYWDDTPVGTGGISVGTEENPWPKRNQSTSDWVVKYLMALLVSLLAVLFYLFVMKVLIPGIKSLVFRAKYYNKYKEESGIQKITCSFCRGEINPGDLVVTRCKHIMHKKCWEENGYQCAEYGQNCKVGIQDHVDWKELFGKKTMRDSYQTIAGVCAGLFSWIIYNLLGNGAFGFLSKGIVQTFYHFAKSQKNLSYECATKVSSFLAIGLLMAFFLSFVFRYFDGVRKKDWKSLLRISGWSLLSGVIGMVSFAIGGIILCLLSSRPLDTSPALDEIHWYYSMPAYLLFSVCTSLSLTIKSSIPAKSALIGGLVSAIIGFAVIYFSGITSPTRSWMNMLLDFVIYGGGLGASIVTVRMLAEKYFLVIKNGVKQGHRIPIHKWMNATGGNNAVTIGMTQRCEIQMTWEKSNKVAKEHARLYVDHTKAQAMLKPMASNVIYNSRAEVPVNKPVALSNNDTFKIGDTIFQYVEN